MTVADWIRYNENVLQVGDRVVAINDTEISEFADIKAIVSASKIGDELKFQVYRNSKLIEVNVICYEKVPEDVKPSIEFKEENTPKKADGAKTEEKNFEFKNGSGNVTDF